MSRKHYQQVASLVAGDIALARHQAACGDGPHSQASQVTMVRGEAALQALRNMARGMADMFQKDNPAFDRARFYLACGIGEDGFS